MSEAEVTAIAIIGMAGRFPGADSIGAFWENLRDGVESIVARDTPAPPDGQADGPRLVRAAALLDGAELFDAAFFEYTPREAEIMDPQQRVFLECAWHALEHAGYAAQRSGAAVGVFAGSTINTYLLYNLAARPELIRALDPIQINIANAADFLTTRVSYKLGLRGPSHVVQSACSTSLVAVHVACQSLWSGECDMALAGGVSINVSLRDGYRYAEGGMLSPDGRCRPFDAQAAGTVFGSGVGVVVLKRLEEALRDGDTVHAVIKGSAVNNDGDLKVGYTAPSVDGQAQVIAEALANAGVAPESISYVEAHGTATPLGDPIEVQALTKAFRAGTDRRGFCAIGSVKGNVGHLDAAAGVAGLIKTVLALKHGQIPPTLHYATPNPNIDFERSPFVVNHRFAPWRTDGGPRRAGVSAFGVGGTNAHVIVEQAPPPPASAPSRPGQLLLLSARSAAALEQATANLAETLRQRPELSLADVAYTLQVGRAAFEYRRMLVCHDHADALQALEARDPARLLSGRRPTGRVAAAFLFPGQGSQQAAMAREIYWAEPVFRRWVDRCAELLAPHMARDLRALLLAEAEPNDAAPLSDGLADTQYAQPALFVVEYALAQLWMSWGVRPAAMIGHSIGEYVAACLAGVFTLEDALSLVAARGRLMQALPPGAMLAVPLSPEEVAPLLGPDLALAAHNGPALCVLAGPTTAVAALEQRLADAGLRCRRLRTAHAFHSAMVEPMLDQFATLLRGVRLQPPQIRYISNVTGGWISADEATDPCYWLRHTRATVQFSAGLQQLLADPALALLEVGPGQSLSAFARQHDPSGTRVVLASLTRAGAARDDLAQLRGALGQLWLAGASVDWATLHAGERRRRVPLPGYPFERRRFWIDAAPPDNPSPTAPPAPAPAALAAYARPDLPTGYRGPRDEREQTIAAIWQALLGVELVGVEDNFFALGGHSLLAVQLLDQIGRAFLVDLPLRTLVDQPTVAGLAAAIAQRRPAGADVADALAPAIPDPARRHEPFPLNDVQQAYWIGRSGAFELGAVAAHGYIEFESTALDLGRLTDALRQLIARHDMLRAIVLPSGQQQILPQVPPYQIATDDQRGQSPARAAAALEATRQHMSHQVLPSDQWPLFDLRATLLDGGVTRLHISLDILILDAWSLHILADELVRLYQDPALALEPLAFSFRDYVLAEAALRGSPLDQRAQAYWWGRLDRLPPAPPLPLATSPSALGQPQFVRRSATLAPERWAQLKRRAALAGLTPSGVLLAAFGEVLAVWSASSRFTINLTLFNRLPLHPQVNQLVGDFTSLTLLEIDHSELDDFTARARRIQQQLWDDLDHRFVGGVRVLRELARRSPGAPRAAMPVVFTSTLGQGRAAQDSALLDQLGMVVYSISQTPQVWLDHQVFEDGGALVCNWDAVEALFPAGLLADMFAAYCQLLTDLATTDQPWQATERQLVPPAQLAQRAAINGTDAAMPTGLLHTPWLAQVARQPEQLALVAGDTRLTYAQLHQHSTLVGAALVQRGVLPNTLVAVVMEKGWEQVVAALGVLLAGAAYLPIDAGLPSERVWHLLEHGEVRVVLTQSWVEARLAWPAAVERLCVDQPQPAATPLGPPRQTPDDLAYVIYTSGSTGLPKGVMIDHRSALNTVADINQRFGVGPGDRVLALSSLSFDLSVYDIFGALAAGGTIVIPDAAAVSDPAHWVDLLLRERVTLWNSVPALLELLVDYARGHPWSLPALRLVLLSGDWIPLTLPDAARRLAPAAQIVSLGGATEAAIWSILYPIDVVAPGWRSIPYGLPMRNQSFQVLDERLEPCPVWVPGQLYIGGAGLALGYWRDAERTAASFIRHPRSGERLYRTGDQGRYLPDGTIEFLGRDDFQVKIRGYRVELGEIEAALLQHPAVRQAVVDARGPHQGHKRLVAYVVLGQDSDGAALRAFLHERLPEYMVPTAVVALDRLPLTPNGKVNRAALPDPAQPTAPTAAGASAAATQIGQLVSALLDRGPIDVQADLFDLGLSSVDIIRIVNMLERELGFRPTVEQFYHTPTINSLAALYDARQPTAHGALAAGDDYEEGEL